MLKTTKLQLFDHNLSFVLRLLSRMIPCGSLFLVWIFFGFPCISLVLSLRFLFIFDVILLSFLSHLGVMLGSIWGSCWGHFGVFLQFLRGYRFQHPFFTLFVRLLGPKLSPSWPPSWAKLGSKTTFNFA